MRWSVALGGAALLWAATPPRLFPGAEFLVVLGLAGFCGIAHAAGGGRRRRLGAWAFGALHTWAFSISLAREFLAGWVAIGLVGGLYWMAAAALSRRLAKGFLPWPLGFAIAVALCFWARANMPEILYPHGQACHALYLWPRLMEPLAWGGEVFANALLAASAACLWALWRRWRVGPSDHLRRPGLAFVFLVAAWGVALSPAPRAPQAAARELRVAALEPGADAGFQVDQRTRARVEQDLLAATDRVAGRGVEDPPGLVLWPESSYPGYVFDGQLTGALPMDLHPDARLVVGAIAVEREGARPPERIWRPCAMLLGPRGEYLDRQDKLVCVPGGEKFPLAGLVPGVLELGLKLGVPHFTPGAFRGPLAMADGTRVGGVTCYENAFPWIAARQVDAGARLLAVVTNEAWYHRGAELWQMDALSVCRAVETRTPVVRCTVDGRTMAVDGEGRIVSALSDLEPGAAPETRILEVSLALGPAALPPLAWLHPWWGWAFVLISLIGSAHFSGRAGRLLHLRQRLDAGAVPPSGGS